MMSETVPGVKRGGRGERPHPPSLRSAGLSRGERRLPARLPKDGVASSLSPRERARVREFP